MLFKGKVALVTGGSRGVGKAISAKLADMGADVIINYFRKKSTAKETAAELTKIFDEISQNSQAKAASPVSNDFASMAQNKLDDIFQD